MTKRSNVNLFMGGYILDKKQLIIEAAIDLFSKQGFEQTSIQQITEQAGISKGAFYLSFKSKNELILSLIEYFIKLLLQDIERVVNSKEKEPLKAYLTTQFTSIRDNSFLTKLLLNEKVAYLHPMVLEKMPLYFSSITEKLLLVIQKQYPNLKNSLIPEVIFLIKGLITCYGKLFIYDNKEIQMEYLVETVYEKINVLVTHSTLGIMTYEDVFLSTNLEDMKTTLLLEIDQILSVLEDEGLKEVLLLLKNEIITSTYPRPVINGLITLLKNNKKTSTIAILADYYFQSC